MLLIFAFAPGSQAQQIDPSNPADATPTTALSVNPDAVAVPPRSPSSIDGWLWRSGVA